MNIFHFLFISYSFSRLFFYFLFFRFMFLNDPCACFVICCHTLICAHKVSALSQKKTGLSRKRDEVTKKVMMFWRIELAKQTDRQSIKSSSFVNVLLTIKVPLSRVLSCKAATPQHSIAKQHYENGTDFSGQRRAKRSERHQKDNDFLIQCLYAQAHPSSSNCRRRVYLKISYEDLR